MSISLPFTRREKITKARRFGRRDIKRRIVACGIFGLLLVAVLLAGIMNTKAAEYVSVKFKVDLSEFDFDNLASMQQKIESFLAPDKKLTSSGSDAYRVLVYLYKYTGEPVFEYQSGGYTSLALGIKGTRTREDGLILEKQTSIEPGKYYVTYVVQKAGILEKYYDKNYELSSYIDDYYYETNGIDENNFTLENGYPADGSIFSVSNNLVTIGEDGSIVDQNNEDYIIKVKPRNYEEDPLKVDIVLKNVNNLPIPAGEKIKATLEMRNTQMGDYYTTVATTEMPITGEGKYVANFNVDGLEEHPFLITTESTYSSSQNNYCIGWEVVDASGKRDPYWGSYDCGDGRKKGGIWDLYLDNIYYYDNSSLHDYQAIYRYGDLSEQIYIRGAKAGIFSQGRRNGQWNISWARDRFFSPFIIVSEYSYIDVSDELKYRTTSQDSTAKNEFHLAQSVNDIKDGGHYMLVAKDYVDNSYYALSVNGKTNTIKLSDLNDENLDSYKITDDALMNSDYVYTVRSSEIDGSIAQAKFLSNIKSGNGRPYTLKLNTHSYYYDEMFNDKGGVNAYIEKVVNYYYGDDEHEDSKPRFRITKGDGLNQLFLNDLYGNPFFSTYSSGRSYVPTQAMIGYVNDGVTESYFSIVDPYDGNQITGFMNSCRYITTRAFVENNNKYCTYKVDNIERYDNPNYQRMLSAQMEGVYILTDSEIEDPTSAPQKIEDTYMMVDDEKEVLSNSYNFLLVKADTVSSDNPIGLSASNIVSGQDGRNYYTGYTLKNNNNDTYTTEAKNSFGYGNDWYDEESGIKEQKEGSVKLYNLKQNDATARAPYLMVDADDNGNFVSYSTSKKEMSLYFNGDGTVYVRGGKSDRWIGWGDFVDADGNTRQGFISVPTKAEATKFSLGMRSKTSEANTVTSVNFYTLDGEIDESFIESYYRSEWGESLWLQRVSAEYYDYLGYVEYPNEGYYQQSTNGQSHRILMKYKLGEVVDGHIFAGYTTDRAKSGIVALSEATENIYDKDSGLDSNFMNEYLIVSNSDYVDLASIATEISDGVTLKDSYHSDSDYHVDLYPVFIARPGEKSAVLKDPDSKSLIGATDWKDNQGVSSSGKDDQVWQGSINVEVYVDGKPYGNTEKLYYKYHNDNSADVILKFIDDGTLSAQAGDSAEAKIQNYLLSESILPAKSQNGDYVIDAIIAEQSGSEDGLVYEYNWIKESGARLDNVKGGSTIKIYMSNQYQVKYYLDGEELSSEDYDSNYYASNATKLAIEEEDAVLKLNQNITDEELRGLIDKDTTMVGTSKVFKPADQKRFVFENYSYVIHDRNNEFIAAKVPQIPTGLRFKSAKWQIKDQHDNVIAEVSPEELAAISEQENGLEGYFEALTRYAYTSSEDDVNTFHLYLYTEPDVDDSDADPATNTSATQGDNPITFDQNPTIYVAIFGILGVGLLLAARRKRR